MSGIDKDAVRKQMPGALAALRDSLDMCNAATDNRAYMCADPEDRDTVVPYLRGQVRFHFKHVAALIRLAEEDTK